MGRRLRQMTCVSTSAITTMAGTPNNHKRIGIVASFTGIPADRAPTISGTNVCSSSVACVSCQNGGSNRRWQKCRFGSRTALTTGVSAKFRLATYRAPDRTLLLQQEMARYDSCVANVERSIGTWPPRTRERRRVHTRPSLRGGGKETVGLGPTMPSACPFCLEDSITYLNAEVEHDVGGISRGGSDITPTTVTAVMASIGDDVMMRVRERADISADVSC